MGTETLDFLTEEELNWIIRSSQTDMVERSPSPKRKKVNSPNGIRVGEILMEGTCLCKEKPGVNDQLYSTSMHPYFRLASKTLGREIVRIGKEDSKFLSDLKQLEICDFDFKLVSMPGKVFVGQGLLLQCVIRIRNDAFVDSEQNFSHSDKHIAFKKSALDMLFKRLDLIESTQESFKNEDSCTNLLGNFGAMFSTSKQYRMLDVSVGMNCTLHDYQKEALGFLFDRETAASNNETSALYHKIGFQPEDSFYYSPFLGEIRRSLPSGSDVCKGGILGDEMGLGKTIEMLALVHTNKSKKDWEILGPRVYNKSSSIYYSPATYNNLIRLVVGPPSLLSQWQQEIERFFDPSVLNPIIYHGSKRTSDSIMHLKKSDLVLTTYPTLARDFENPNGSFHKINWHRVILDEAHTIRSKSTKEAKACFELEADYRWCVTGTPVINKIEYQYLR